MSAAVDGTLVRRLEVAEIPATVEDDLALDTAFMLVWGMFVLPLV